MRNVFMPAAIVECVPNFSEGRDQATIKAIADAIGGVTGVDLLNIDIGPGANRTVMTFTGGPDEVAEAAFQSIAKASTLIDMREHHGTHPRIGATDVFPFVPIHGITLAECAKLARQVGRRVGRELGVSVFFYEAAAKKSFRKNLADIRHGEYEGLAVKLLDPRWTPDCGPATFQAKSGATVVGAREFLIAYNITLATKEKRIASDIAAELRASGRAARRPSPTKLYADGEPQFYQRGHFPCGNCEFVGRSLPETERHCQAKHGYNLRRLLRAVIADYPHVVGHMAQRPGEFQACKAIGWFIEEYRRAQISFNLTDYHTTPPHVVFERAKQLAADRGSAVTGSEVIGMIPYPALLEAGKFYLRQQGRALRIPSREILQTAVAALGLNDVQPFDIRSKVIGLPRG
jgi:glutamate formiminotransferase / formiminotetrahydrofolate cyclodeaminase